MSRSSNLRHQVTEFSDNLFSTLTDMVLATIYSLSTYASTKRKHWSSIDWQVEQQLHQFNSQTIKRAISHLYHQGHINSSATDQIPQITNEGIAEILGSLPQYKTHRPWDGYFYLISYDLPTTRNSDRNHLRYLIKLLGCVRLQHKHLDNHNLTHAIAVSRLENNIGLGTTNIVQLYPLAKLNQSYQEFISNIKKFTSPFDLSLSYWQILRNDPQLPFELLPKDWLGDKAYQLFHQYTHLT